VGELSLSIFIIKLMQSKFTSQRPLQSEVMVVQGGDCCFEGEEGIYATTRKPHMSPNSSLRELCL
jgi:hypothetical protein